MHCSKCLGDVEEWSYSKCKSEEEDCFGDGEKTSTIEAAPIKVELNPAALEVEEAAKGHAQQLAAGTALLAAAFMLDPLSGCELEMPEPLKPPKVEQPERDVKPGLQDLVSVAPPIAFLAGWLNIKNEEL